MSYSKCNKGKTYHDLIIRYIETIGTTECPADSSRLSLFAPEQVQGRAVGQVVSRNGAWEIHMVRVEAGGAYRLIKEKLRSFSSRKIAEIVAKYTAANTGQGKDADSEGGQFRDLSWN